MLIPMNSLFEFTPFYCSVWNYIFHWLILNMHEWGRKLWQFPSDDCRQFTYIHEAASSWWHTMIISLGVQFCKSETPMLFHVDCLKNKLIKNPRFVLKHHLKSNIYEMYQEVVDWKLKSEVLTFVVFGKKWFYVFCKM